MCFESTIQMLKCAFPDGITDEDFLPLLYVLKPYFSIRSLASCIVAFLNGDYQLIIGKFTMPPGVKNYTTEEMQVIMLAFIYQTVGSHYNPELESVNRIQTRLNQCGFAEWVESEY